MASDLSELEPLQRWATAHRPGVTVLQLESVHGARVPVAVLGRGEPPPISGWADVRQALADGLTVAALCTGSGGRTGAGLPIVRRALVRLALREAGSTENEVNCVEAWAVGVNRIELAKRCWHETGVAAFDLDGDVIPTEPPPVRSGLARLADPDHLDALRTWSPRPGEDQLLKTYWDQVGGSLRTEARAPRMTSRGIDGVLVAGSHGFRGGTPTSWPALHGHPITVVEVKSSKGLRGSLWNAIGQALSARVGVADAVGAEFGEVGGVVLTSVRAMPEFGDIVRECGLEFARVERS